MEQFPVYNVKISRKFLFISIVVTLFTVILVYFSFSSLLDKKVAELESKFTLPATPVFKETQETTLKEEKILYTVKEFNGKIGVFKNGDFQYNIDVYVFTLPEIDKELLRRGIEASSEQELNDIISCYY